MFEPLQSVWAELSIGSGRWERCRVSPIQKADLRRGTITYEDLRHGRVTLVVPSGLSTIQRWPSQIRTDEQHARLTLVQ